MNIAVIIENFLKHNSNFVPCQVSKTSEKYLLTVKYTGNDDKFIS